MKLVSGKRLRAQKESERNLKQVLDRCRKLVEEYKADLKKQEKAS